MRRYFNAEQRRRFAPLVLLLGLAAMVRLARDEVPRDQEVRFVLAADQRDAQAVQIVYANEGEDVTGIELRFPQGAPGEVVHTPSLRPGNYELAVELRYGDGRVEHVARSLAVPSEGAVRIRLDPSRR